MIFLCRLPLMKSLVTMTTQITTKVCKEQYISDERLCFVTLKEITAPISSNIRLELEIDERLVFGEEKLKVIDDLYEYLAEKISSKDVVGFFNALKDFSGIEIPSNFLSTKKKLRVRESGIVYPGHSAIVMMQPQSEAAELSQESNPEIQKLFLEENKARMDIIMHSNYMFKFSASYIIIPK